MTNNKNFSNQDTPYIVDTEYKDCNFSHTNCITVGSLKRGHRLFPGDDTPRTFIDCNLTNAETPPGSVVMKANGQQLGATIIERAVVVGTELVDIDGEQIEVKDYVDRIHGHYYQGAYSYKTAPIDIPVEAI